MIYIILTLALIVFILGGRLLTKAILLPTIPKYIKYSEDTLLNALEFEEKPNSKLSYRIAWWLNILFGLALIVLSSTVLVFLVN